MGLFDSLKKIVMKKEKPKKKATKKAPIKKKIKIAKKTKTKSLKRKSKSKTIKSSIKKVKKVKQKKPEKQAVKAAPVKEKEIGVISHYFGKISVGIIKLKSNLKVGDKIHIKGAHDDFTQNIKSMQYNHKSISQAAKGKEIGVKVKKRVHVNDKVYISAE